MTRASLVMMAAAALVVAQDKTLEYKPGLGLNIYQPPGWQAGQKRTAMVFFFGGGWTGGSVGQFAPHAKHFAAKGAVAICADYRVKTRHNTTPFDAIADGKAAIAYVREHARELGIDAKRIVAAGGSAGGHVAAAAAILPPADHEIAALVLFNPVVDTTAAGYGAEKVAGREKEASPVHNVTRGVPPAILFHGTADTTVPFANAEAFCAALKGVRSRCELVPYEGQKHGFFNATREDGKFYPDTVAKAEVFLRSLRLID
jgi:acetyl esterase/lipase